MQFLLLIFVAAVCVVTTNAVPQYKSATEPQKPDNDKIISEGITSFAVNLIKNLHKTTGPEENILTSPANIYESLSLLHLGAAGTTRNELSDILGLPKDDKRVEAIHQSLGQISKKLQYKPENEYERTTETSLANGIFVNKGFPINENYIQLFKKYHDGNVSNVDFAGHTAEATKAINSWVSEKTKGLIPQIYSSPVDPSTVAVLLSSLYFSGKWSNPFYEASTKLEKFNTGVQEINTYLMNRIEYVPYISKPDLQLEAISIPYWGNEYSMVIVLPQPSQTLEKLTTALDTKTLGEILKNSATQKVDYKIPKMNFSWQKSLLQPLSEQGVNAIFNTPDLSNLAANIKVSDILHVTKIEVDEEGTKAAAITATQLVPASGYIEIPPKQPIPFYVNRPFLFYIYYYPKDIILFSGVVHKPTTDAAN